MSTPLVPPPARVSYPYISEFPNYEIVYVKIDEDIKYFYELYGFPIPDSDSDRIWNILEQIDEASDHIFYMVARAFERPPSPQLSQ